MGWAGTFMDQVDRQIMTIIKTARSFTQIALEVRKFLRTQVLINDLNVNVGLNEFFGYSELGLKDAKDGIFTTYYIIQLGEIIIKMESTFKV